MRREDMIRYIETTVQEADDRKLEQIYWMLIMEFED